MNPENHVPHIQSSTLEERLGPLNEVERKHAPARLDWAGEPAILRVGRRVSIVGSRQATDIDLEHARTIASGLARHGVVVVSGLAEGIDTAAHQAAIDAGGRTIAVLGTPIDEFFPAKNRRLQEYIMREHLAVSQFASGMPSQRGNFPRRNRTMALLSDATVIIAAGEKSGSLHQGWEALRLGRPLFLLANLLQEANSTQVPHEVVRPGQSLSLFSLFTDSPEAPKGTWAAEFERYGAIGLEPSILEPLLDALPERSRGEVAELTL